MGEVKSVLPWSFFHTASIVLEGEGAMLLWGKMHQLSYVILNIATASAAGYVHGRIHGANIVGAINWLN